MALGGIPRNRRCLVVPIREGPCGCRTYACVAVDCRSRAGCGGERGARLPGRAAGGRGRAGRACVLWGLRRQGASSRRRQGGPGRPAGVRAPGAAGVVQAPLAVSRRGLRGARVRRPGPCCRAAQSAHDLPGGAVGDTPGGPRSSDQGDRRRAGMQLAHRDGSGAPVGPGAAGRRPGPHRGGHGAGPGRDIDVPPRPVPPQALGHRHRRRPTRCLAGASSPVRAPRAPPDGSRAARRCGENASAGRSRGLSGPYREAFRDTVPHAIQIADPFHVVKLANSAVDDVTRRVPNETTGRRGAKHDHLYRTRRLLLKAAERVTERGRAKLRGPLAAGDPRSEALRRLARHRDPARHPPHRRPRTRARDPRRTLTRPARRNVQPRAQQARPHAPRLAHTDHELASLQSGQRADRGSQQPRQAHQAHLVRDRQLRPLPHTRPALRRKARLEPARRPHPTPKREEPVYHHLGKSACPDRR